MLAIKQILCHSEINSIHSDLKILRGDKNAEISEIAFA
jgi:hypothetical protein